MAKKKASDIATPMPYKEPTPKEEFAWALDRAVEKAVLAHPKTQKLREAIKQRMAKAAGNGHEEASGMAQRVRSKGKKR